MKLYLTKEEVWQDETVQLLKEELVKTPETYIALIKLIERTTELANSHIWGTLIMLIQDEENRQVETETLPATPATVTYRGQDIALKRDNLAPDELPDKPTF